ncbi:2-oxopent-4-enoate hydratase [Corynebacterium poyangense]|uniref:2-oxopent-4-enoate hydratase n=1 Tax=Corynebacterium poyangense TaxID=2684405 RepID=A0A7H0SM58_9CORY|nr:fumarylacetoacetate hydrolase family protein [Corynebacterium poyangense]QNQ89633.1 2-oxopent-4-enoate hydratase [Corynebacterium poyangense]
MTSPRDEALRTVAEELFAVYDTKEPVTPPRTSIPGLSLESAYRIQQFQEDMFLARGDRIAGRKIGLTSRAMQEQLGVDSPDFGFFTDQMCLQGQDTISADRFLAPKVEPELAFHLGTSLNPGANLEEISAAISGCYLAVEIIDSRVKDWDIQLVDTVADNASCGAVVLSDQPVDIALEDLSSVSLTMYRNSVAVGSGTGTAVMGNPIKPLEWLNNTLSSLGTPLQAGDIILTGSFCAAAPLAAGDLIEVDYGPYGTLRLHCV